MSTTLGRRILVVGTSGCGKTTVAQALAERLSIPYVSNDEIIWRADWTLTPRDERWNEFDRATAQPAWVLDGNFIPGNDPEDDLVLSRADTIVWLDLSRWIVHSRVISRTIDRVVHRRRLFHDNVETLGQALGRNSIIWWSLTSFARRRRQYAELFESEAWADRIRVRLRTPAQVATLLDVA